MNRNATRIFFLIGIVAAQSSCNTGRQRECEKHIKEEIHPGVPLEIAEAGLKKCGFKTTIDPVKKTFYGNKVGEGSPVSERTQVSSIWIWRIGLPRSASARGSLDPNGSIARLNSLPLGRKRRRLL
jgi:hypothetical protein